MRILSFLFGRKPAPKPVVTQIVKKTAQSTKKTYPNRKAKRKVYPIFAADYCGDYEWQRIKIDRENPTGFMPVKRASKVSVKGVNIDNRAEPFFLAFDIRTAELEVRREPDNPEDPNALAIFGTPRKGHQPVFLGYVPEDVATKIAEEFTPDLPLKARLRTIAQKSNGNAVMVQFALLYPKVAERKPFLRSN